MSWTLRKPNVALRVTKFAPEADTPVAGLTPEQRAAHREAREKECAKREPGTEYPDWRVEELARKYDDREPPEPRRGFYDPYG